MKDRRSWLHRCAGRKAVALSGARPGTIHRTNLKQFEKRIGELETPIQPPHAGTRQKAPRRRVFVKSDGRRPPQLQGQVARRARIIDLKWPVLVAGALFLAISGCSISTTSHGWPGSYAPAGLPNAQNCVPISFGQPTEFACPGGKVYTAQQLKSLRQQKAAGSTVASAGY
jgi:hypothetical protein